MRPLLLLLLSALVALLPAPCVGRTPSDPTPVSTSIDGLADFTHTLPFVDIVKQSRPCGSAQAPYDGNCTSDANGWPTQDFGYVLITTDGGALPPAGTGTAIAGVYTVYATGNATVALSGGVSGAMLNQSYDASSNTLTAFANCTGESGLFWLSFTETSRLGPGGGGGGLTNVRVLQPGYGLDRAGDFTDAFLQLVSRFDSLRFMDWRATNDNVEVIWANRSLPSDASYVSARGIPWEVCVALANRTQRDMWINIPAMADDEYVVALGHLLAASVDPSLNIYYEYSNEVWNWQFQQTSYSFAQANASVVLGGDPYRLNYDNCSNPGYWLWRRTAYEAAVRIPALLSQGFGAGSVGPGKRVRPILSAQASQPFVATNGLDYLVGAGFGAPGTMLDALAVAPYFNLGDANDDPTLDVDGILAAMAANAANMTPAVGGLGVNNPNALHAAVAAYHGLQMRAYEGGPDTSCPYSGPNNGCAAPGSTNLAARANASIDPRMQGIVEGYLAAWSSWGPFMGPLNYFVAGATPLLDKYGVYGLLYDMTVPSTPKSRAVDAVRAAPRPPPDASLPALPSAFLNATHFVGHNDPIQNPCLEYLGVNQTFFYLLRAGEAPAGADLRVTALAATMTAGQPLEISVTDLPQGPPAVNVTTQAGNYFPPGPFLNTTSATFRGVLSPGAVIALRLRNLVDHGYSIAGLILEVV